MHKNKRDEFELWVWRALLFWSIFGYAATALKVDAGFINTPQLPQLVQNFARLCLAQGGFIFLFLAALNIFLVAVRHLGFRFAALSFLIITLGSGIIETLGTLTGFPFGYYLYTANLGPRICGILPLAIPLAWWSVLGGFYLALRIRFPKWNQRFASLCTAVCATAFDWIMEPFAWLVKTYWVWVPGFIPWQNYVAWFAVSFLLVRFAPLHGSSQPLFSRKPALVLFLMITLFVLGRLMQ